MPYTVDSYYKHIHSSWEKGASMSDMYHMILKWMQDYRPQDKYPVLTPLIERWLEGALEGEETNKLIEEFLFADQYREIHAVFEH